MTEMELFALLVAHEALCGALFYASFCRAVRSDHQLRLDVRVAFWFLGVVPVLGLVAPLVWLYQPDFFSVGLLFSIVFVQYVTARDWAQSAPSKFMRPQCRGQNRRSTDLLEKT